MSDHELLSKYEKEMIQSALRSNVVDFFPISSLSNILYTIWSDTYKADDLDLQIDREIEEPYFAESDELDISDLEEIVEDEDAKEKLEDKLLDDLCIEPQDTAELEEEFLELDIEEPEIWMIGFSPEFKKSIKRVEKKLKGRILDALEWLSRDPVTIQGNTVKPLSGDYSGLWRYRVGNYRLIYKPDGENKRVTLLTFSPRSSAY